MSQYNPTLLDEKARKATGLGLDLLIVELDKGAVNYERIDALSNAIIAASNALDNDAHDAADGDAAF